MKIGLDFDGVIVDSAELKTRVAEKLYGVTIPNGCFTREKIVGDGFLNKEEYDYLQEVIHNTTEYGLPMIPVSFAIHNIFSLLQDGHEIKVVTSRSSVGVSIAQGWLRDAFSIHLDFISVGPGNSKGEAAQYFDVYIDDDVEKLEEIKKRIIDASFGPEFGPELFLFSWPYNWNVFVPKGPKKVHRVSSWPEFLEHIQRIQSSKKYT